MSKYLKYTIKNIEPLRIADDNTSLRGQTITLRYIPGTSIRGYVINQLAKDSDFEDIKVGLFRDKVCFLNAYISVNGKELIPSPKGFYEDKTGNGEIECVLKNGSVEDGKKRASLGRYCYLDNDTIYYYSVDTGSDMKITIQNQEKNMKQDVFRNEYILKGNYFTGYIKVDNDVLRSRIKAVFQDIILIGNGRSQGLGKCKVISIEETDTLPYCDVVEDRDMKESCYLYLLSNSVMRDDNGNYAGLDRSTLERKLGISDLEIDLCSTSIVEVKGYNRNWKTKIQSVNMYEQGSIFKLKYTGTITADKAMQLMNDGIGVRRNEGYGRVLFLKEFENFTRKQEGEKSQNYEVSPEEHKEDQEMLKLVAKNYYMKLLDGRQQECLVEGKHEIVGSKAAHVRALISANKYDKQNAIKIMKEYFVHEEEKEQKQNIQKKRDSIVVIRDKIYDILDHKFETTIGMEKRESIMGIKIEEFMFEEDYLKLKLNYILKCMKMENRREVK